MIDIAHKCEKINLLILLIKQFCQIKTYLNVSWDNLEKLSKKLCLDFPFCFFFYRERKGNNQAMKLTIPESTQSLYLDNDKW